MNTSNKPKFLADQMLGRLARWLRIFGFDTAYSTNLDDAQLLKMAKEEHRILLSRDTQLLKTRPVTRREIQSIYLKSDHLQDQINEVIKRFALKDSNLDASRCPLCNSETREVSKKDVCGKVPSYIYRTQEMFSFCPQCKSCYWKGTHWKKIQHEIGRYRK